MLFTGHGTVLSLPFEPKRWHHLSVDACFFLGGAGCRCVFCVSHFYWKEPLNLSSEQLATCCGGRVSSGQSSLESEGCAMLCLFCLFS